MPPQQTKSASHMMGAECRNVATYQHHRPRRTGGERATHATSQITTSLSDNINPSAPTPSVAARVVRGHRNSQTPPPVGSEPAHQQRDHQPLEAHRRDIADLLRQTTLAAPKPRCAHKQDEITAH
jgi:hypothetical protein